MPSCDRTDLSTKGAMMHAGVSEVDITPETGLPLAGMPSYRVGRGTEYPLRGRGGGRR